MIIRYAIQFVSPEGVISYHMQGLPNVPDHSDGFEFAIMYATILHAKKAANEFKLKARIKAMKNIDWTVNIIPVQCILGDPIQI